MTISRVKPAGWGLGDELTPSQINALDANSTYALDKRAGQTDTLASNVAVTGNLEITGDVAFKGGVVVGSSATFHVATAATFLSTLTASGGLNIGATSNIDATLQTRAGAIVLGNNDYPQLKAGHVGRTQVRLLSSQPRITTAKEDNTSYPGTTKFDPAVASYSGTGAGVTFLTVDAADATASLMAVWNLDSVVPNGATITLVEVALTGSAFHVPTRKMCARVQRVSAVASGPPSYAALHSSGANVADAAVTSTDFANDRTIGVVCNQNNVVDKSLYNYVLSVGNEGGSGAVISQRIAYVKVTYKIDDLRPA